MMGNRADSICLVALSPRTCLSQYGRRRSYRQLTVWCVRAQSGGVCCCCGICQPGRRDDPQSTTRAISLNAATALIESLLPVVMRDSDTRFGGPLGTTFLIAMSTPMILLPLERMLKPADRDAVANDRCVDETLGKAVTDALSPTARFGDAPFAREGAWSYVPGHPPFNLAKGMPHGLVDDLSGASAASAAMDASAGRILIDLRNAVAHGGIALNERAA